MRTKLRQKTKNIKKCLAQMFHGKPKRLHFSIKLNYTKKRGRKNV